MHIDDQILLSAIDFQMATRRDVHFFYTNNFQPRRCKSLLKHFSFAKPECNNCYLYLIINYFWQWKKDVTYMISWPTSFFHEDANPQKNYKKTYSQILFIFVENCNNSHRIENFILTCKIFCLYHISS